MIEAFVMIAMGGMLLWLYGVMFLDNSSSPGVALCRYIRHLTSSVDVDMGEAEASNAPSRRAEFEFDPDVEIVTITTPNGRSLVLDNCYYVTVTIDSVPLPLTLLDRTVIWCTIRSLYRLQRKADRSLCREIVSDLA